MAPLALAVLLAASAGRSALDTASLDLRHRWVALTAASEAPPTLAAPLPAPLAGGSVGVGMNTFLEQEVEPAKRQQSLEMLRAAGVSWVRQEVPWEAVEPVAPGETTDPNVGGSTWEKFDDIVARARALDLDLILRLDTSPAWARPAGAPDGKGPPAEAAYYWDFVEAVARRYQGQVRAYQVWNEPNLAIEWGGRRPDPAAYVALLRGAAARIRRADPNALVLMAAMAPTLTDDDQATNDLRFLQGVYDAGGRGAFDVLAVQAYGLRGGPDDPRVGADQVTFSRPSLVRALMVRNGDAERPIWATEMGWNANPPHLPEQRFGRVTPLLQARYTVRAFERARAQWPWMQVLCVWYWKRADEANRGQDWYWFRLADPDLRPQPAYEALRDAAGA